jgi:hypothetical protein
MAQHPRKTLTLSPLTFEEAVTDILKIKPEPIPPKKRPKTKTWGRSKVRGLTA